MNFIQWSNKCVRCQFEVVTFVTKTRRFSSYFVRVFRCVLVLVRENNTWALRRSVGCDYRALSRAAADVVPRGAWCRKTGLSAVFAARSEPFRSVRECSTFPRWLHPSVPRPSPPLADWKSYKCHIKAQLQGIFKWILFTILIIVQL